MCGIAGMVDLTGRRPVPRRIVQAMADALVHRGPDADGFFERESHAHTVRLGQSVCDQRGFERHYWAALGNRRFHFVGDNGV